MKKIYHRILHTIDNLGFSDEEGKTKQIIWIVIFGGSLQNK
jgi:hypothetical protein